MGRAGVQIILHLCVVRLSPAWMISDSLFQKQNETESSIALNSITRSLMNSVDITLKCLVNPICVALLFCKPPSSHVQILALTSWPASLRLLYPAFPSPSLRIVLKSTHELVRPVMSTPFHVHVYWHHVDALKLAMGSAFYITEASKCWSPYPHLLVKQWAVCHP